MPQAFAFIAAEEMLSRFENEQWLPELYEFIVFDADLGDPAGFLGNTLYGASKAGVAALTKGLARELGPMGINVNAIAPAVTGNTGMVSPVMADDVQAAIARRIPIGRLAKPSDTAALAVFLSSDVVAFISGAIIPVDGGLMTT